VKRKKRFDGMKSIILRKIKSLCKQKDKRGELGKPCSMHVQCIKESQAHCKDL